MNIERPDGRRSLLQAAWAKQREYDEPFLIPAPEAAATVIDAADIPVTQDGRFFHLAASDKGRAVSMLMALFRRSHPGAVGVLNQDTDGGYDPRIACPGLRYADGIGPGGWNAAIANLVDGASTGLTR